MFAVHTCIYSYFNLIFYNILVHRMIVTTVFSSLSTPYISSIYFVFGFLNVEKFRCFFVFVRTVHNNNNIVK